MKKKRGNLFFRILTILFIIYVALFIVQQTGYYDKTVRDQTLMTEEKIKQFESDVAQNKAVDVINYLPEKEDYSNFLTRSANVITNKLGDILDKKVDNIWDIIKSLFIG